jgi:hypothetical protein
MSPLTTVKDVLIETLREVRIVHHHKGRKSLLDLRHIDSSNKHLKRIMDTVYFSLLILSSVINLTLIPLYFFRRKLFPIAQRLPCVVMIEVIALAMSSFTTLSVAAFSDLNLLSSCTVYSSVLAIMHTTPIFAIAFRIGWLVNKELYTKLLMLRTLRMSEKDDEDLQISKMNWGFKFLYHLLKFETRWLTLNQANFLHFTPMIAGGIFNVTICILRSRVEDLAGTATCRANIRTSDTINASVLIYGACLLGIAIVASLLRFKDNFKIGYEIKAILCVLTIELPYDLIFLVYLGEDQLRSLIMPIFYQLYIIVLTGYPVYLSYRYIPTRKTDQPNFPQEASAKAEFQRCLEDFDRRLQFLKFLEDEFAVENLLFYEACTELEANLASNKTDSQIVDEFCSLKLLYLNLNSPSCVNLSHRTRQKLIAVYEEGQGLNRVNILQCVHIAKEEIFQLMKTDSFSRFRVTPIYKDFLLEDSTVRGMKKQDDDSLTLDSVRLSLMKHRHM